MKLISAAEKGMRCFLSLFLISTGVALPVYAGSYQVSTGAVYYESGFQTVEKIVDNGAPISTIGFAETADVVFASSNLATGHLKVWAVSNQGSGRAGWFDEVDLEISGLDANETETIRIHLVVDGTYRAPDGQAAFSFYALSGLETNGNVDVLQTGASYDTNQSSGVFHTVDPDLFTRFYENGNWLSRGPRIFIGQIDIQGDDPTLRLDMDIYGVSGPADFSNTAAIWLELPEGTTINSASGVLLSQADPPLCESDIEPDQDVDGLDLLAAITGSTSADPSEVAIDFGRNNCLNP